MKSAFIGFGILMVLGAVGAAQAGSGGAFLLSAALAAASFFAASKVKTTRYRNVAVGVGPEKTKEHF